MGMVKVSPECTDEKRAAARAALDYVDHGIRLSSSEFPQGYVAISYGRGTWLLRRFGISGGFGRSPDEIGVQFLVLPLKGDLTKSFRGGGEDWLNSVLQER